jgi:TRAP-type mannitol/chloroaromatic compound transport system permease small subunit
MEKVIQVIDKINEVIGKVIAWLVVPLTLIIVFEVIKRRLFNAPSIWSFELSSFLFGAHFMLAVAYGLLHKAHVSVALVRDRFLSLKAAAVTDLVVYFLLFIPFSLVILIYGTKFAVVSWTQLETSWSVWHPPVYPIKTVIPITAGLFLLQGLSEILKKISFITSGGEKWSR